MLMTSAVATPDDGTGHECQADQATLSKHGASTEDASVWRRGESRRSSARARRAAASHAEPQRIALSGSEPRRVTPTPTRRVVATPAGRAALPAAAPYHRADRQRGAAGTPIAQISGGRLPLTRPHPTTAAVAG